MLSINRCLCGIQKSCPFVSEIYCGIKLKFLIPVRTVSYKYKVKTQDKTEGPQLRALSGLEDPHFTDNLKIVLRNPKLIKQGLVNFKNEVVTFCKEEAERMNNNLNPIVEDRHDRIDILYKFEKPEDLNGFSVNTDSSFSCGYSSALLRITPEETAEFSGHICQDVPKDGNVQVSGFANMMCPTQNVGFSARHEVSGFLLRDIYLLLQKFQFSFFRRRRFNWTMYTHLVLKIRGDGRTYLVIMNVPEYFEETKYHMYAQPLFTRGGPYWQMVKMPFSHFFFMNKGGIAERGHSSKIVLSNILRMGITAASYEGAFKLEIDYIGLTFDNMHKKTSPYEEYRT